MPYINVLNKKKKKLSDYGVHFFQKKKLKKENRPQSLKIIYNLQLNGLNIPLKKIYNNLESLALGHIEKAMHFGHPRREVKRKKHPIQYIVDYIVYDMLILGKSIGCHM